MPETRAFSDVSFRQFLSEERLMGCRCKNCGVRYLPPRPICTACFSQDLKWVEMPETGKLAAFTCITIAPPAMLAEGYNRKNPYCSGVVEVEKGIRVDARIEGIDTKKPEEIKVGMTVRADFQHRDKECVQSTLLVFRPV